MEGRYQWCPHELKGGNPLSCALLAALSCFGLIHFSVFIKATYLHTPLSNRST